MFSHKQTYFYYIIISGLFFLLLLPFCKKLEQERILQINTPEKIGMIDSTTVVVRVTIADLGGNNHVIPGFCWSEEEDPDINDFSDTFVQINTWSTLMDTIAGLEANKLYYLKAFVIEESSEVSYCKSVLSFRTGKIIPPILSTDSVKIITVNSARAFGRFVDKGTAGITQYGHCWSVSQEPKIGTDSITKFYSSSTDTFSSLLTGLKIRIPYCVISYAITQNDTIIYADSSVHFKISGIPPSITTDSASVSGDCDVMFYGNITSSGTDIIIQYGHCWSLEENPTVLLPARTTYTTGITTGTFTSPGAELLPDTTYYVRAYVITKYDTIYGNQKEFNTPPAVIVPPEVTTDSVVRIDISRAYCYGTLTKTGSYPVIQHGHCWSFEQNPDITTIYKTQLGSKTSIGKFESLITDLIPDTVYYVKAYAMTVHDTVFGSQKEYHTPPPPVTFTDVRDGQIYEKIRIGDYWWMAENLNFQPADGSYYYANDSLKYHQYGRLYTWETASAVCPAGWHLPSDEEWKNLEEAAGIPIVELGTTGPRGNVANKLKPGGSLNYNVQFGGLRYEDKSYYGIGVEGYYWTATEQSTDNAWQRKFHRDYTEINRIYVDKSRGLSVRCVED